MPIDSSTLFIPQPSTKQVNGYLPMQFYSGATAQTGRFREGLFLRRLHAFKRIKSLGGFAQLQADDTRLARSWLLAHLIAVVLIDASLGEGLDSPP